MTRLIKLAVLLFLAKTSKSAEMYSDYLETHVIHFDRWFDDCPNFNSTVKVNNVQMSGNKTNMVASALYIVEKDYPKKFSISLDIERCASKEAPDTCVQLTTLTSDRVCIMIQAKDQFYSTVLHCFQPTLGCPIKKGLYNGKDCYLKMTKFKWFPIPTSFYYKIRYVGLNKSTKEAFFCHLFALKLERKRNVE